MTSKRRGASRVIHAGLHNPEQGAAFSKGPAFASTYHLSGNVDAAPFQYGRFANPTWEALEIAISELEMGDSVIFPSGMAAIAAVLTTVVVPGDTILLPSDGYYATRAYAEAYLQKFGVKLKLIPTTQMVSADLSDIKMVLLETPSNPMLDVVDISTMSERAHRAGALLAVDNTVQTPLGQQPLELGADFSISSDTKAFNGHSDVLFGHVSSKNASLIEEIRSWRKLSGSIPGPMETWLVHRSLATLDMRLERMAANAMKVAEYLHDHPKVSLVRYPGLVNDPSHKLACEQMHHFGSVVSFELRDADAADCFLQNAELIFEATSFGGIHTMGERRARWGTDDVSEGLVRLSVGCEAADDLIADIAQALGHV